MKTFIFYYYKRIATYNPVRSIVMSSEIYISNIDREKIMKLIDKMPLDDQTVYKSVTKLKRELGRAKILDPKDMPHDVVTMNSQALLRLNDEDVEVSLVYPEDTNLNEMKVSVFSPIGTAILGYREGSTIEWEVPSGTSTIIIKKILYQPEAAGEYHL